MRSNDKGSPTTGTLAHQLRHRKKTSTPRSEKAMSTLSDRVGKRGWTRKVVNFLKACLECHRRKIKCNMTTKSRCTSCERLDVPCSVNEYRRRRNKEKRSKIDELESNIERMENVFERLGLMRPFNDLPGTPVSFSQSYPSWNISDTMSESGSDLSDHPTDVPSAHPPASLVDSKASSGVEGDSDVFLQNLACPRILVDLTKDRAANRRSEHGENQHQAKDNLRRFDLHNCTSMSSLPVPDQDEPFDGTSTPKTFYPLPGIAETMVLFLEFLENFNSICPLFQPVSLLSICDEDSSITPDKADLWACINVVLALAHTMRSRASDVAQSNHQISWMFMKNALQVANSLCNSPPTLWAAQALLGITVFLLGTLNDKPCDLFVPSALRITHDLLLGGQGKPLVCKDNLQLEQCRMVFWIAYCLDQDISLRFGGSLGRTDEYIDIEFSPGLSSHHCIVLSDQEQIDFDVFRSYCELSVIKGQVYKLLCSATTPKQSTSGLADLVAKLDEKLRGWKASVPKTFRPDVQDTASFPKSKASVLLLSLHFSYFNCLLSVHQALNSHGSDIYMELAKTYSSGMLSEDIAHFSAILCQNAARASIKLIKQMPAQNPSMVGILLHYLVVATEMLSKQIVINPASGAWGDIHMINQVESFLSSVVLTAPNEGMHRVVEHCTEQRLLAESAVNGVDAQVAVQLGVS
ncbi:hypothetical protein N7481_007049 [Penicillium waksmanii]|uniref:uncharacterized protein n=1 Tax=Penicillium waksmanii TaxID=69791 RepID=UPI002549A227|nr:uncharacterized protein N7481_007049 [Penicillium waksmanii]KAJ5979751.1 hypothetical protein N7481_007049 [Penicillium waksmanii]